MWQTIAGMFIILALSGCEEVSPGHNVFTSGNPTGGQLYVSTSNSILRFSGANSSSGNIAPAGVVSGANTLLSAPQHIFLDVPDNRLYVANQGGPSILVFDNASTLDGDVSPSRVISGNATSLLAPFDVTLDPINNLLYVADGASILVFAGASTVNGNAPLVRTITLSFSAGGLLLDAPANQLHVSGPGNNVVDRLDGISSQNGAAIVSGSLAGPLTMLAQPRGLVLDASGRLIVSNTGSPASITIYPNAATASGNMAPDAEIAGSSTLLQFPAQMALNASADQLFVLDSLAASVLVFRNIATVTGDVAPDRIISGPATGITANAAHGIAIDPSR
jgi:hypothetical protein